MPHYKDGTEAKVGDQVVGRGYNVKHLISGVLVDVKPVGPTCNVSIAHAQRYDGFGTLAVAFPMMAVEYGQADHFERADLHEKRLEAERAAAAGDAKPGSSS